jgi:hypothetical protein
VKVLGDGEEGTELCEAELDALSVLQAQALR